MPDLLNYETLTFKASTALIKLDETFIGTEDYMGIAYFWGHEYKHLLRSASFHQRKRVHQAMLQHGLALDGESKAHATILRRIFPRGLGQRNPY